MSLIEEALRRLQDPAIPTEEKAASTEKPTPAVPTPASSVSAPTVTHRPAEPAPAHSWPTTPVSGTPTASAPSAPAMMAPVIAILVLGVALIAGGAWWWGRMAHAPLGAASTASVPASPAIPTTPAPQPPPAESETRSPVRPPAQATQPTTEFALTGVAEGLGEPYAVINGSVMAIGDRVGDATLVEIGNGSATLRRADGTDVVLRVPR